MTVVSESFLNSLIEESASAGIHRYVVGAVICDNNGKFLILRRAADDFMGGIGEIASGKVDAGESLDVALKREVFEETGLTISEITNYVGHFDYTSGSGRLTRQFNFKVKIADDSTDVKTCPEEHDSFSWVDFNELSIYKVTDSVIEILRQSTSSLSYA
jgi:8-oxo-dGTP diphosphatase